MTTTAIKELRLHTFTDEEMQLVESALIIARDRFRDLADVMRKGGVSTLERDYNAFADAAGELALKIETSR